MKKENLQKEYTVSKERAVPHECFDRLHHNLELSEPGACIHSHLESRQLSDSH